ncbi:MAG: exodeoxyribonuclease VII small subunit [Dehalococcoidia bacterium]|tara:strand:+ start:400 stop:660 length:261 start_codon:yes stop_codon:yes gene_type:complete
MSDNLNLTPDQFENSSFEEVLALLNDTVSSLDQGNLSLDQATNLYEQGMMLSEICLKRLTDAQLKITNIQEKHSLSQENTSDNSYH